MGSRRMGEVERESKELKKGGLATSPPAVSEAGEGWKRMDDREREGMKRRDTKEGGKRKKRMEGHCNGRGTL